MGHRFFLTLLTRPGFGWLAPLRRRLLVSLPFEAFSAEEQDDRREWTGKRRVLRRLPNGLRRWRPLPPLFPPLHVLSRSYFREQPLLARANLCRLLGLHRLEEQLLEQAADDLAERCGPVKTYEMPYRGLTAKEIGQKEAERLEAAALALAERCGLLNVCVRCEALLPTDQEKRLVLWRAEVGAICDACRGEGRAPIAITGRVGLEAFWSGVVEQLRDRLAKLA